MLRKKNSARPPSGCYPRSPSLCRTRGFLAAESLQKNDICIMKRVGWEQVLEACIWEEAATISMQTWAGGHTSGPSE
jgi:hypothetical protein